MTRRGFWSRIASILGATGILAIAKPAVTQRKTISQKLMDGEWHWVECVSKRSGGVYLVTWAIDGEGVDDAGDIAKLMEDRCPVRNALSEIRGAMTGPGGMYKYGRREKSGEAVEFEKISYWGESYEYAPGPSGVPGNALLFLDSFDHHEGDAIAGAWTRAETKARHSS